MITTIEGIRNAISKHYNEHRIDHDYLFKLQEVLECKFSDDFVQICNFFSGGCLGIFILYDYSPELIPETIAYETIRLKKVLRSNDYIVLGEIDSSLLLYRRIQSNILPNVIWIPPHVADGYVYDSKNVIQSWHTYFDFMCYAANELD